MLRSKGRDSALYNFDSTKSAAKNKKRKSVIDFRRNTSAKELMNYYKTYKNNPYFKKEVLQKTKTKNSINNSMIQIEDLHIINETLSQHTEKQLLNNKYKCFLGKDIIDKIYFCPEDNIVIFNFEEINKIGVMLLELLRTEAELSEYDFMLRHLGIKYDEELNKIQTERESLYKEYLE